MKHYRITLEGHPFDVEVLDDPRQRRLRVRVDGEVFTVEAEAVAAGSREGEILQSAVPESAAPAAPSSPAAEGVGAVDSIKAPLPGMIKSIAVRPGQQVAAGDELLIIEAMKMDNIIRAMHEGTVGALYVVEGRQVAHGEPLLDLVGRSP
jgi:glutaconyl-CoA/methylmalonyl-CoA decarboxylase subunit gamma